VLPSRAYLHGEARFVINRYFILSRGFTRVDRRLPFINSERVKGKTQKFAQRSKDIGHESKKTWDMSPSLSPSL